jgi:hypothetical protein
MNERATRRELEKWAARTISLSNELQAKQQQLRNALHQSERSHLMDLLTCSICKTEKAEAEVSQISEQRSALQMKLWSTTAELEACYQELLYTNQELCEALNSAILTCEQAKQRATTLLQQEGTARDALAALLSSIYGSMIKPWELQTLPTNYSTSGHINELAAVPNKSLPLSEEAARFKADHLRLAAKFAALKAQLARLQAAVTPDE